MIKQQVFDLFVAAGARESAARWEKLYEEQNPNDPQLEIARANFFWRWQIGTLPFDTVEIRSWLDDNAEPTQWLESFRTYVMPIILDSNLPQKKE